MKKKTLLTSILTIVMCLSLTIGATFALFTSKSEVNIAVSSATVDVKAVISDLDVSMYAGTATKNGGEIAIERMLPGDSVSFDVHVENESDVPVKYRTVIKNAQDSDEDLFNALKIKVDGNTFNGTFSTPWTALDAVTATTRIDTIPVSIVFPEGADGANLMDKTIKINVLVEAIQGNAETEDEIIISKDVEVSEGGALVNDSVIDTGVAKAELSAGTKLNDGADTMTLMVSKADEGINTGLHTIVDPDKATALKVKIPEVADDNQELIKITLKGVATKNVNASEIRVYHEGVVMTNVASVDALFEDSFYYDAQTGDITIAIVNFSNFTIVEGGELQEYTIANLNGFKYFRDLVNEGENFKNKTVKLANDIDLANEEWTPIGKSGASFSGTFDGNGKVISNLKITGNRSDVGLFGFTTEGEIKNLTVENASVEGYLCVGVVAGTPYTSKYTNVTVKGHVEVNGFAYVGGVGGKNAYANWTDVTVNVDETSYVKAISTDNVGAYRTYVGGVVGFNGEGSHTFKNITSNIDVIGDVCDIGGVFGIAHYGNMFENITCTGNVTNLISTENDGDDAYVDVLETGLIAGVWYNMYNTDGVMNFVNVSATGTISAPNLGEVKFNNNGLVGKGYSSAGKDKLYINELGQ